MVQTNIVVGVGSLHMWDPHKVWKMKGAAGELSNVAAVKEVSNGGLQRVYALFTRGNLPIIGSSSASFDHPTTRNSLRK
ncbi:hypothetical protein PLESHI_08849 [Plesiomonas shigelloides 302-73]|uniref:Uncharacterized protein n=1 Tax=Plesiomonas shigelloides 302-73 TaxID=1315976 RepID=R8AR13_PLESH|nr:hypothetical protein PLESHI_08849 [Plesiomonas shigelloides 302-73]